MSNLSIETKVDSAAKIAAVAGKPTKNYLFADEVNSVVSFCNMLRGLCLVNSSNINAILENNTKVELGEIETGTFISALNEMPIAHYIAPVFITYTTGGIDYVQSFIGTEGSYGLTKRQFLPADFLLIFQSDATPILTDYELFGKLNFSTVPRVIEATHNDFGAITITSVGVVGSNLYYLLTFPVDFDFNGNTVVVVNSKPGIWVFKYFFNANTIGIQANSPYSLTPESMDGATLIEIYIKHKKTV